MNRAPISKLLAARYGNLPLLYEQEMALVDRHMKSMGTENQEKVMEILEIVLKMLEGGEAERVVLRELLGSLKVIEKSGNLDDLLRYIPPVLNGIVSNSVVSFKVSGSNLKHIMSIPDLPGTLTKSGKAKAKSYVVKSRPIFPTEELPVMLIPNRRFIQDCTSIGIKRLMTINDERLHRTIGFIGVGDFDKRISPSLQKFFLLILHGILNLEVRSEMRYHEAVTDSLTDLNNRGFFDKQYVRIFRQAQVEGAKLCVVGIDIDFFKSINDTFGHAKGDEVLEKVGSVLKAYSRQDDLVCRVGGEEFCIVTTQGPKAVEKFYYRIRKALLQAKFFKDRDLTISMGAAFIRPADLPKDLTKRADKHLYQAKSSFCEDCRNIFDDKARTRTCPKCSSLNVKPGRNRLVLEGVSHYSVAKRGGKNA